MSESIATKSRNVFFDSKLNVVLAAILMFVLASVAIAFAFDVSPDIYEAPKSALTGEQRRGIGFLGTWILASEGLYSACFGYIVLATTARGRVPVVTRNTNIVHWGLFIGGTVFALWLVSAAFSMFLSAAHPEWHPHLSEHMKLQEDLREVLPWMAVSAPVSFLASFFQREGEQR